ncbi:MAG: glycosyltransferase [Bacteroidota bacterium]|nr:glycosyltransferase [Bacteroidota bacterium]
MSTFVSVGNATQPFHRLVREVERLAAGSVLPLPVFVQYGRTPFRAGVCEGAAFLSMEEFARKIREAEVVILQGGAGSIITALSERRMPIIVPRLRRYGEVVDDHQLLLTRRLEAAGRIIAAYDVGEIPACVNRLRESAGCFTAGEAGTHMLALLREDLARYAG